MRREFFRGNGGVTVRGFQNGMLFMLFVLAISVISGFRVESGADYFSYSEWYYNIKSGGYNFGFEPLIFLLFKVAPNFNVALFLVALLTNLLTLRFGLKVLGGVGVFSLFYLLSDAYLAQFNTIRQMLAFGFL